MKTLFLVIFTSGLLLLGFVVGGADAKCLEAQAVDPADFVMGIDNPWLPMVPGTTFVYEAEDGDEFIRNEITVTSDTVTIMGVTCMVVHDVGWVYIEDLGMWFLTEETYDWYAQDVDGNVWYFGEDTLAYEYDDDWNLVSTSTEGAWTAGVDGALPGIVMLADPAPGICYQQEFYEGEAEDYGKVLRLNADVSVEYGDFEGCLVTKEWSPLERGAIENKFYAYGIGLVYIKELKGKTVHVELVDILTP